MLDLNLWQNSGKDYISAEINIFIIFLRSRNISYFNNKHCFSYAIIASKGNFFLSLSFQNSSTYLGSQTLKLISILNFASPLSLGPESSSSAKCQMIYKQIWWIGPTYWVLCPLTGLYFEFFLTFQTLFLFHTNS